MEKNYLIEEALGGGHAPDNFLLQIPRKVPIEAGSSHRISHRRDLSYSSPVR